MPCSRQVPVRWSLQRASLPVQAYPAHSITSHVATAAYSETLTPQPHPPAHFPWQVALVGAPNVGKSSLVQLLSSGLPEVQNYPFTTRSIKMGHFYVAGRRHQVTGAW